MEINLIFVAILAVFLTFVFRKKAAISGICIAFVVFYVVLWLCPVKYIEEYLPMISIEESEEKVDKSGSYILSTGTSALVPEEFIVTSSSTVDQISSWIQDTAKPVIVLVKNGDKTVYSKNLGVFTKMDSHEAAENILQTYKTWQSTGVLPSKHTYLKYGNFFIVR